MMDLRYPTGEFEWPTSVSSDEIEEWIDEISALPRHLRSAVGDLGEEQLDTCYRPGGRSFLRRNLVTLRCRLVEAIHRRWVVVLRDMDESAMARTMRHAELGEIRLDANIGLCA